MERIEILRARIALCRRYLREGVDSQIATAYLWLIRQNEIELAALVESPQQAAAPEAEPGCSEDRPPEHSCTPEDGDR